MFCLSNVAGKGSRQLVFCTTERAIFDNSRFEVGEKLLSSQLVVEISSEEKKSGIWITQTKCLSRKYP